MPRSRSRDSPRRSQSPSRHLPGGAEPITESDYFLKSSEFRVWLKDEKRKYFDELSGEKARKYFHKFVKVMLLTISLGIAVTYHDSYIGVESWQVG
jgi:hypothetical protein